MSLHEKISSLYDDELDAADRDQVVDSLRQDEQKMTWGRYSMIGEAMRRNLPNDPGHDLFSRVQSAIEAEPALLAPSPANVEKIRAGEAADQANVVELPTKSSNTHSFKPFAGIAVAASVALASVLGFQMFAQSPVDAFSNGAASSIAVISSPVSPTFELVSEGGAFTENVAFSAADIDEPASAFDDVTYAQQSLTDDGQWTRITRIGDVILDNNIFSRPPEFRSNVDLKTGSFPFARAASLETVTPK